MEQLNAQSTMRRLTSTSASDHSMNQHRATYAAERARVLFGSYRRGDANDPDAYVASIAAVLSMYEPELVKKVTDPRTGIQTTEKFMTFMPNSGELKRYCDEQAAIADRFKRYAAIPPQNFRRIEGPHLPRHRANVRVPPSAPQYQAMAERAGRPDADPLEFRWDGDVLWVPYNWLR
jgi:hypothetical protein